MSQSCVPIPCGVAGTYPCVGGDISGDVVADNCACACRPGYTGAHCDACLADYEDVSADGQSLNCQKTACSAENYGCLAHGVTSITGDLADGNCVCHCAAGYTGTLCDMCATNYRNSATTGTAVTCTVAPCTHVVHACDHGHLSGNLLGECDCACHPGYTGTHCDRCAATHHPTGAARDATVLAAGQTFSPIQCDTTDVACVGGTVTGDLGNANCVCDCSAGYTHANCDRCAEGYYNPATNGYAVTTGQTCGPIPCSNDVYLCVGGTHSGDLVANNCACTNCAVGHTGEHCDQCATNYHNPANGASTVSVGQACAPIPCSTEQVACVGGTVTGDLTDVGNCQCVCAMGYSGGACDQCAPNYQNFASGGVTVAPGERCDPNFCDEPGHVRNVETNECEAFEAGAEGEAELDIVDPSNTVPAVDDVPENRRQTQGNATTSAIVAAVRTDIADAIGVNATDVRITRYSASRHADGSVTVRVSFSVRRSATTADHANMEQSLQHYEYTHVRNATGATRTEVRSVRVRQTGGFQCGAACIGGAIAGVVVLLAVTVAVAVVVTVRVNARRKRLEAGHAKHGHVVGDLVLQTVGPAALNPVSVCAVDYTDGHAPSLFDAGAESDLAPESLGESDVDE